jgi:hypothetical protein
MSSAGSHSLCARCTTSTRVVESELDYSQLAFLALPEGHVALLDAAASDEVPHRWLAFEDLLARLRVLVVLPAGA